MTNTTSRRFQIGTNHLEVTLPLSLDKGNNARNFLRDSFANIPLPPDIKVQDVTKLVHIEALSALLLEAKHLGAKGTEHLNGRVFIRFEHAAVVAVWCPLECCWEMTCGVWEDIARTPVEIRRCLATALADNCLQSPGGLGQIIWLAVIFVLAVTGMAVYAWLL